MHKEKDEQRKNPRRKKVDVVIKHVHGSASCLVECVEWESQLYFPPSPCCSASHLVSIIIHNEVIYVGFLSLDIFFVNFDGLFPL